jgi:hypothetical protein
MKYKRKTAGNTGADYLKRERDCKRTKYNPRFRQSTGIQKKLVATYKQNAS